MIIKRNIHGEQVEIELTAEEMRLAGEESSLASRAEDVLGELKELAENGKVPLTVEQLELIPEDVLKEFTLEAVSLVAHQLGKNDSYWESFWFSVDFVLTHIINWDEEFPKLLVSAAAREG